MSSRTPAVTETPVQQKMPPKDILRSMMGRYVRCTHLYYRSEDRLNGRRTITWKQSPFDPEHPATDYDGVTFLGWIVGFRFKRNGYVQPIDCDEYGYGGATEFVMKSQFPVVLVQSDPLTLPKFVPLDKCYLGGGVTIANVHDWIDDGKGE